MVRDPDCRVARGSSVVADPCEGHIGVMISYVVYKKLASHLATTGSHITVEELTVSILEAFIYVCASFLQRIVAIGPNEFYFIPIKRSA